MKHFIFLLSFIGSSLFCWGQNFKGTLLNADKQPIASANIILLSLPDSTLVKGTISNEKGVFEIPNISNSKNVALKIIHLEYKTKIISPSASNLGNIVLEKSVNELGEVVVSSSKPIMKQQGTKIITSVSTTSLQKIPNIDLLLNFLPGVSTSHTTGGFEVFGKGKPLFYINNKRVRDMGDVYRLLPQDIDKIEVDTQPGAEHDNSVGAIIRIILKRRQGDGLSGDINVESEFKKGQTFFIDANFNYRVGKTDVIFAVRPSFNFDFLRENTRDLSVHTSNNNWRVLTNENVKNGGKGFYMKTGFSHEINNNHSFGASVWTSSSPLFGKTVINQQIQTFKNDALVEKSSSDRLQDNKDRRLLANAYYEGKLSDNINLQTDVFYTGAFSDYKTDIVEENLKTSSKKTVKNRSEAKYHLWAMKSNLLQKIGKTTLSYGVEASTLNRSENYSNNLWDKSDIDNKEERFAGFASYSFPLGKVGIKSGLRYEYSNFEYFESDTKNTVKSRVYNHLLPNVSVGFPYYSTQWSLSYAKKIHRPAFYQLSDFSSYENSFLFNKGNANILPCLEDNISLQTSYRNYSLSVDYRYIRNGFYEDYYLLENNPDVVVRTTRNFDDYQSVNVTFSAIHQIKFWVSKISLKFKKQFAEDVFYHNKPIWGVESMNQLMLSENTVGYILLACQSEGAMGANEYAYKPSGMLALMMSHAFFNRKLEVYCGVMDVFNTLGSPTLNENQYVTHIKYYDPNVRSFRLGLQYKFNPTQSKYKGQELNENRL